jgi:hypothetical protein
VEEIEMSGETTAFINNQNNKYSECEKCHGGVGKLLLRDLTNGLSNRLQLKFMHDDILKPGTTFGMHCHGPKEDSYAQEQMEEWYVCLSGEGVMINEGKEYPMKAGDASVCYFNGTHGIKNTGKEDMRILVLNIKPVGCK